MSSTASNPGRARHSVHAPPYGGGGRVGAVGALVFSQREPEHWERSGTLDVFREGAKNGARGACAAPKTKMCHLLSSSVIACNFGREKLTGRRALWGQPLHSPGIDSATRSAPQSMTFRIVRLELAVRQVFRFNASREHDQYNYANQTCLYLLDTWPPRLANDGFCVPAAWRSRFHPCRIQP